MREVARIMVQHKFINDVEDVWYMKRAEIKDGLWDLVTGWATGSNSHGPLVWPAEIAWRKSAMEKFREWTPPDAMGTVPETISEPFTIVLWGITSASMAQWARLKSIAAGDLTKMIGFPGSPGIAEGTVRVCRTAKEIGDLKEGEILVAPTTSPSWAPAFQKIKAAITDVGGVMCHAAIVCREVRTPGSRWNRFGHIHAQNRTEDQGGRIDRGNRNPLMRRCGGGSSDGHLQIRASLRGMRPQYGS